MNLKFLNAYLDGNVFLRVCDIATTSSLATWVYNMIIKILLVLGSLYSGKIWWISWLLIPWQRKKARNIRKCEYTFMFHYNDVIMSVMASQITSLTIAYSTVCSGADHRKHQRSSLLAFVRGIHRWPVNSPHKGPVTRKLFPFDDVIMSSGQLSIQRVDI